jgi:hypothetical protein
MAASAAAVGASAVGAAAAAEVVAAEDSDDAAHSAWLPSRRAHSGGFFRIATGYGQF